LPSPSPDAPDTSPKTSCPPVLRRMPNPMVVITVPDPFEAAEGTAARRAKDRSPRVRAGLGRRHALGPMKRYGRPCAGGGGLPQMYPYPYDSAERPPALVHLALRIGTDPRADHGRTAVVAGGARAVTSGRQACGLGGADRGARHQAPGPGDRAGLGDRRLRTHHDPHHGVDGVQAVPAAAAMTMALPGMIGPPASAPAAPAGSSGAAPVLARALPPLEVRKGNVVDVTLVAQETTVGIVDGETYPAWTFGAQVPGPVIRLQQGDIVHVTFINEDTRMAHSLDLHAAATAPSVSFAPVLRGKSTSFTFTADHPGVCLYHVRDAADGRAHCQRHVRRGHRRSAGRSSRCPGVRIGAERVAVRPGRVR